jgi:uncharacterized membrane protein YfcA
MDTQTLMLLLLTGLTAGILGGFIGVGGGVIIVPAMVYFMGMDQHMAQGTSVAMMLPPIGILAYMNYHKAGAADFKAGMILALTFIIGGYLGSKWSLKLDPNRVKLIFGFFMVFVAFRMIFTAWKSMQTP